MNNKSASKSKGLYTFFIDRVYLQNHWRRLTRTQDTELAIVKDFNVPINRLPSRRSSKVSSINSLRSMERVPLFASGSRTVMVLKAILRALTFKNLFRCSPKLKTQSTQVPVINRI